LAATACAAFWPHHASCMLGTMRAAADPTGLAGRTKLRR